MIKPLALRKIKKIHFIGIKGVGMTALACCAQDLGIKITGSDVEETFVTDDILKKRNIKYHVGFSQKNITNPDLVITTGAHGGLSNPEAQVARQKGIKVISQAEGLALFSQEKETISVCGVGGKTTTASMIATIFGTLGFYPSYAIGVGQIKPLGDPGCFNTGKYFITEADEYAISPGIDWRPRFFFQNPRIIVVTNIEHDHPDVYPNLEATKKTFKQFFQKLPRDGVLIACIDNKNIADLIKSGLGVPIQTYGFSPWADWRIEKISFITGKTFFSLTYQGIKFANIALSVPGRFNALNATAAFAVANFLGGNTRQIITGLEKFLGSQRRFELIEEINGIKLYDDYAHHPTEIRATLKVAREWFPDSKITAIFQPHTFTRTQVLMEEFASSFSDADQVLITNIYSSAREKPISGVNASLLTLATKKNKKETHFCPNKEVLIDYLVKNINPGDLILTLGAGDIFLWHKAILKAIKQSSYS